MPSDRRTVAVVAAFAAALLASTGTAQAQIATSDQEPPDVILAALWQSDAPFADSERAVLGAPLQPNDAIDTARDARPVDNRDPGIDGSNDRLIDRLVDPFSWLMQFRFRNTWNWPVGDSGPDSQEFQFRPTIPFKAWDQVNLLRIRIPYDIEGAGAPGLDKVSAEDAVIFEPTWGRIGIGPAVQFDPNSSAGGEFQIGPLFGVVAKTKHWTYGFITQNYLGGTESETQMQPILAYKFNDRLAVTLGEMQFKYDWSDRRWRQVPLGVELNYISDLWGQKISWFVNPQYNFVATDQNSGWRVYVGLVLLVPGA